MSTQAKQLTFLLVAAAALYLAYLPSFPIGSIDDDAKYILLGQSLLHGHYADPAYIVVATETAFPPGYPFFLALFIPLVQSHWFVLQLLSIALTLLAVAGVWFIAQRSRSPMTRVAVPVLFAINPVVAKLSGCVMAESLYTALQVGVFWALAVYFERGLRRYAWIFALLLAWALLTRSTGIFLLLSVILGLALARDSRRALPATGLAVTLGVLWICWDQLAGDSVANTLHFWKTLATQYAAHPMAWIANLLRASYFTFSYTWAGLSLPRTPWGIGLTIGLSLTVIGSAGYGVYRWLAVEAHSKGWVLALAFYSFLLFMEQVSGTAVAYRYVVPLVPILLLLVFEGLPWRRVALGVCIALGISYAHLNGVLLYETWKPLPGMRQLVPTTTFDWMKKNLPAHSTVIHPAVHSLYLHTGFQGLPGLYSPDKDQFRLLLLKNHIQYALTQPLRLPGVPSSKNPQNPSEIFATNSEWLAAWPEAFAVLYKNEAERATLYEVKARLH